MSPDLLSTPRLTAVVQVLLTCGLFEVPLETRTPTEVITPCSMPQVCLPRPLQQQNLKMCWQGFRAKGAFILCQCELEL